MQIEDDCRDEVTRRLRRVQGQVAGVIAMIEDGRECADVITQLSAASKALDRAGLKIVSDGIRQCARADQTGQEPPMSVEQLEKLFLSLA
ncbi:MAG: metal-sensitive transcriptional regulator [Actinobacteria bacterium]|nr:metal-sensitive transcriptional regulator [Actinomycetota bacterium]